MAANNFTSLEELLGEENYQTAHEILGYKNQLSLIENVENKAAFSKVTIRVDKALELVKNVLLPNIAENDVWLREFVETFTKKYQGISKTLPEIRLTIEIFYNDCNIADINGQLKLEDDYKLELEDTFIVKKSTLNFDMKNFTVDCGDEATVNADISSEVEKIQLANMKLEGQVDFLHEDSATFDQQVIDSYRFALHADVNPFAFADAMDGEEIDWNKIDWKNFGYLNLRLSLVEDGSAAQSSRHNGQTEYLNVLIDSETFGENILVYIGLYNPQMKVVGENITKNHIFNSAISLPMLMNAYAGSLTSSFPDATEIDIGLVVDALKGTISYILNSENETFNDVVYKFLEGIMKSNKENVTALKENFYFEEGKIFLRLENAGGSDIKEIIAQSMSKFSIWLDYSNFTSNMFGSATHISFDFDLLEYGSVDEDIKTADIEFYNSKHKTLVEVVSVEGLSLDENYKSQLEIMKGQSCAINGKFSDGEIYQVFDDYLTENVSLTMTMWDYEIVSENAEKATVKIYFAYAQGSFADILFDKNIPYGLVEYQIEINI